MSTSLASRKRMAEYSTFSDRWSVIEETILCIFRKEVSKNSFQRIHHSVFQLCQAHYGSVVLEHLEEQFRSQVAIVVSRVANSRAYVRDFLHEWQDYNESVRQISNILLYFNKNYMCACHHSSIEQLGKRIFCASTLADAEVSARLALSIKEAAPVPAAEPTIREIGKELYHAEGSKYFSPCMETPFVEAIVDKYVSEGEQRKQSLSPCEYLRWVQDVVSKARHKYTSSLFYILVDRLTAELYATLVLSDAAFVQKALTGPEGLVSLLKEWDLPSISNFVEMFGAMRREKDVIDVMGQVVKEKADAIVNGCGTSGGAFPGVGNMLTLIANAKELDALFVSEAGYAQAPFLRVIRNVLGSNTRFMETLSLYYDMGIRQGKDEVATNVGNDVLTILQLTPDLEAFEVAFRSQLAARLIHAKAHAVDLECLFIDRLFNVYGSSVVNRFQKMVEDIRSATVAQEKLLADMTTKRISLPLDFDVLVLTSGLWPQYTSIPLSIPPCMEQCKVVFQEYYRRRHNGRKLVFQMSLGSVVFQLRHASKVYHVSAHTHFVNTVLALNRDESVSVAEVVQQSALGADEVLAQFNTLCHVGLAERRGTDFGFKSAFFSAKTKVKVAVGVQRSVQESDNTSGGVRKGVEGTKTMSVDAIIVKLLKEHNSMDHETLCRGVETALRDVSTPTRAEIKPRIEALIEKGLLVRGEIASSYFYCS